MATELAKQQAAMEALVNVGRAVVVRMELPSLLELIYQESSRAIEADCFALGLYDPQGEELCFEILYERGAQMPSRSLRKGEWGLAGRAFEGRSSLLLERPAADDLPQGLFSLAEAPGSWLGVPLLAREQAVGVMIVQSAEEGAFEPADQRFLEGIAGPAAMAIEDLVVHWEHERRIAELSILGEISRALSSALELDQLLEVVFQQVGRLFDTTNFYIATYEEREEQWTLVLLVEHGERLPPSQHELGAGLTGHIIRTRTPLLFRTAADIQAFHQAGGIPSVGKRGAFSWLGVPLIAADKVVGVMAIQSYEQEQLYDEKDLALFSTIAAQVAIAVRNVRLYQEARRRAGEMESLYAVSRVMAASMEPEDTWRAIFKAVGEVVPHDGMEVCLYDESREILRAVMAGTPDAFGPPEKFDFAQEEVYHLGEGYTGWIGQNRQPLLVSDVREEARTRPRNEQFAGVELRSYLGVPMVLGERLIGTLEITRAEPAAYDEHHVELLTSVATQAAAAVERTRLFEEARSRADRLAVVNRVAKAAGATLQLDELMERIYQEISPVFEHDVFFIALYDEVAGVLDFALLLEEGIRRRGERRPLGGFSAFVISEKKPLLIRDYEREKDRLPVPVQIGSQVMFCPSWLGVPMLVGDRVIGIICAMANHPYAYREEEQQLLSTIADQVAVALQNVRLFEQNQRRTVQLQTAAQVSHAASSTFHMEELVRESVNLICDRFGFYYVGLFLVSEEGKYAVLRAGTGEAGRAMLASGYQLEVGGRSMIGQCIATGQPRVALDVEKEPERMSNPLLPETRSEMALPLVARGQMAGALTEQSAEVAAFGVNEIAVLQTIADQLATAIANARLFAQTQQSAERSQALYEVSRALSSHLEEEPVMRAILEAIDRTLGCEHANIAIVDEKARTITARHMVYQGQFDVFPEWVQRASYPLDSPDITADVARSGRTEVIAEWDPRFNREIWEKYGHERLLRIFMPIKVRDRVIGVVEVGYDKGKKPALSEDEVQLLATFMDQAAAALENARLYQESEVRAGELVILNEMGRTLTAVLDVNAVIDSLYQHASRLMDTTNYYVALYDAERDEVSFPFYAEDEAVRRTPTPRRAGKGMTEYVIRARQPLLIPENVNQRLEELGIQLIGQEAQSWLGVPMLVGDQVIGVIAVQSYTTPRCYGERHRDLLTAIASQAAIAIQNARLFATTQHALEEVREASERQRRLLDLVRELSTPLVPITSEILVLPLVGAVDSERAQQIMDVLLHGIVNRRARVVIVDITGVPLVDTSVANHLLQATQAVRLLGAECVLVGITSEVAQTVVGLGVDLSELVTRSDLQGGVEYALALLRKRAMA